MPQLNSAWFASQLFWLVISFTLLHLFLSRLVLPPLREIVEKRRASVATDLGAADNLRKQAEQARQEYEQHLVDTRARAQGLMAEEAATEKKEAAEAARRLDAELTAKLAEAEQSIADKKQALLQALTPAAGELTALIVEKLTRRAPSADQVAQALRGTATSPELG